MTQELIDLRTSILEGRYEDALGIVDELEWMSKKAILRNIKSYLIRMLVHLIKNQVEQRLNNSWVASIRESVFEIQDLNFMENKTSHYIKADEWDELLKTAFDAAISKASVEVANGIYKPKELLQIVNRETINSQANTLLSFTYSYVDEDLEKLLDREFSKLPGGQDWI
jgi:hypothetical protein